MKRKKLEKSPTIYIISWNGIDNTGGVERVVGLLKKIIEQQYPVKILDKDYLHKQAFLRKIYLHNNPVLLMILFSICARTVCRKKDLLIGNGFQAPFVKKDISIAHGTMYTVKQALGQPVWSGSTPFEKLSFHKSKRILAVSSAAKASLVQHYKIKPEKVRIINNCVNTDIFFPLNREDTKATSTTILFCGRLEQRKGIDKLYQLASLISRRENIFLKIAATDHNNGDIFSGLRHVQIHYGLSLREMNSFYNKGDVLFVPSRSEGFEMVTLEALAAGIPVVGNKVGAIKELLESDMEAVYELQACDPDGMLRQLIYAADLYRSSFERRLKLHTRMAEQHGIGIYAGKIMKEIEDALQTK